MSTRANSREWRLVTTRNDERDHDGRQYLGTSDINTKMFGSTEDRVGDAVDVRQERLRDQRDSHDQRMIGIIDRAEHAAMTDSGTLGNEHAFRSLFAWRPPSGADQEGE